MAPDVLRDVGLEFEGDEEVDGGEDSDENDDPMFEADGEENERRKTEQNLEPNSQQFIFFVTYEWSQKARVFVTSKPTQSSVI
jgi:hypothetical protein